MPEAAYRAATVVQPHLVSKLRPRKLGDLQLVVQEFHQLPGALPDLSHRWRIVERVQVNANMVYATTRWPHYDFEIFEALDKVRFGGRRIFLKAAVRHRLSAARLFQRILDRAAQLFQKLQCRDANLWKERVDITRDEKPDLRIFPGSSQACSPYRLVWHLCIFPSQAVGEFHETCSRPAKTIESLFPTQPEGREDKHLREPVQQPRRRLAD